MSLVHDALPLNTITIPAPSSVLARALVLFAVKVDVWSTRRRTRKHLRNVPEHVLFDIGLTPSDARLEASKYFWRA